MKKTFKIFSIIAFVTLIAFAMASCDDDGGGNNPNPNTGGNTAVTGVTLNRTSLSLTVGGSATLVATVLPSNAANKNVAWNSSNSGVASVNNGTVTAVSAGSATITVTTLDGGRTATCAVTVTSGSGSNPGTTPDGSGDNTFTSIAAMEAWLKTQPSNSASSPYTVKLNVSSLVSDSWTSGSAGYVFWTNYSKFVYLDLSGSTFNTIVDKAFAACDNLTGVTIGNSVTSIGNNAFDLTGLKSVTIGNKVTSIGDGAFTWCKSLTSVTIPASVTSIGVWAFWNCTSLTSITFQSAGITMNDSFSGMGDLETVYKTGGAGTYTRTKDGDTWTKR